MNINLNTDCLKVDVENESLRLNDNHSSILESKIITKNDANKATSYEMSDKKVRKKLNNNKTLVEKEYKRVITHTREFAKGKNRSKSVTFLTNEDEDENKLVISGNGYIIRGSKDQVFSSFNMPLTCSDSNRNLEVLKTTRSLDNINNAGEETEKKYKNSVKIKLENNSGNKKIEFEAKKFNYVTEIIININ